MHTVHRQEEGNFFQISVFNEEKGGGALSAAPYKQTKDAEKDGSNGEIKRRGISASTLP